MNRASFFAPTTLCLITALTFMAACGDGMIEADPGEINEAVEAGALEDHQVIHLNDVDEIAEAFTDGEATFTPKRAFYGANIILTAQQEMSMEFRFRKLDGSWSSWRGARLNGEEKFKNFSIVIPSGAIAFGLRTQADLDFARLEFTHSLPSEGEYNFEDDIFAGESVEQASLTDEDALSQGVSISGRWIPSAGARAVKDYIGYDSAPSYNGGRNCSGSFTKGARDLGNYLVDNFGGAKYFQGYNCRQIRGRSGMSMHGTGRAIDVFVTKYRGSADNTEGDPIGNWLIQNAKVIGIQYMIWDRTSWGGSRSGTKDRYYSGAHDHADHYHIELTKSAAGRNTQWFRDRGAASDPSTPSTPSEPGSCYSNSLGKTVASGEGVQVSYRSPCVGGNTCGWYKCDSGKWTCSSEGANTKDYANSACSVTPAVPTPGVTCKSNTLGRDVESGSYVQMPYAACASKTTCQWALCDSNGNWDCRAPDASSPQFAHAQCAAPAAPTGESCRSQTLGRDVADGGRVQMSYNACGGTCQWAACVDGAWDCVDNGNAVSSFPHGQCGN